MNSTPETSHGSKLLPSDLAPPLRRHRFRVLTIGARPEHPAVTYALEQWGAVESLCVDELPDEAARERLKVTPVDAVLCVGPLWTPGSATAAPMLNPTGRKAELYLRRGMWQVRWLRGDVCEQITALPRPGDA